MLETRDSFVPPRISEEREARAGFEEAWMMLLEYLEVADDKYINRRYKAREALIVLKAKDQAGLSDGLFFSVEDFAFNYVKAAYEDLCLAHWDSVSNNVRLAKIEMAKVLEVAEASKKEQEKDVVEESVSFDELMQVMKYRRVLSEGEKKYREIMALI